MGLLEGTLRDYHRDPFPYSLLTTKNQADEGPFDPVEKLALNSSQTLTKPELIYILET